jgi:hypothetical protein
MADLGLQIMLAGLRAHLYFFNLKRALFLLCFLFFFGLFVPIASIVHDLTYGRTGTGRNFYQVQTKFSRCFKRLSGRDNPDLVAIGVYDSDFSRPDILIDVNSVGLIRSLGSFC